MHPRYAAYYIRRIRISANDPLFAMLQDQKFPHYPETGQEESTAATFVLEFPVQAPTGCVTRADLHAAAQLAYWQTVKQHFTEHNPSVTVSVADDEWIEVANWLYNSWEIVGGLSFLPRSETVYELAPYEEIGREEYEKRLTALPDLDFSRIVIYEKKDSTLGSKEYACMGGVMRNRSGGGVGDRQRPAPRSHVILRSNEVRDRKAGNERNIFPDNRASACFFSSPCGICVTIPAAEPKALPIKFNLLTATMWNVLVDQEKCTGCGECVDACPGEVYELVNGKAVAANLDECHGCHTCEDVCPVKAISVEDE